MSEYDTTSAATAEDMAQIVVTMYEGVTDQLLLAPDVDQMRAWLTGVLHVRATAISRG